MKGMKAEYWVIISCGIFFVFIAPVYWVLTEDPTGTTALVMTFLLCALLGFFPPYSWWPLYCALALATIVLGVVVGWWLFIIGATIGAVTVCGWVYEYYRGVHAH